MPSPVITLANCLDDVAVQKPIENSVFPALHWGNGLTIVRIKSCDNIGQRENIIHKCTSKHRWMRFQLLSPPNHCDRSVNGSVRLCARAKFGKVNTTDAARDQSLIQCRMRSWGTKTEEVSMTDPVQDDGQLLCIENKRETRAMAEYDFKHKPYCKMVANIRSCIGRMKKHGSISVGDTHVVDHWIDVAKDGTTSDIIFRIRLSVRRWPTDYLNKQQRMQLEPYCTGHRTCMNVLAMINCLMRKIDIRFINLFPYLCMII